MRRGGIESHVPNPYLSAKLSRFISHVSSSSYPIQCSFFRPQVKDFIIVVGSSTGSAFPFRLAVATFWISSYDRTPEKLVQVPGSFPPSQ